MYDDVEKRTDNITRMPKKSSTRADASKLGKKNRPVNIPVVDNAEENHDKDE